MLSNRAVRATAVTAMRAEFINPFINATVRAIRTMSGIEPRPGCPHLKRQTTPYGDVTGLVGLTGERLAGAFAVSFTEACIVRVVSNMLGEEMVGLSTDVTEAVGELTNIISGGARAELAERRFDFDMALPSVFTRPWQDGHVRAMFPIVVIPFETDAGAFFVEAGLYWAEAA